MNNELSKLIDGLRVAKDFAETEANSEMLCFLIEQAIGEAIAEPTRRGQVVPIQQTVVTQRQ
jgi:hypothetical protein